MRRFAWLAAVFLAVLMTATAAVGLASNDPRDVLVAESELGNGDLGVAQAVVGLFAVELQVVQAIGGGHPQGRAFPTEDERRAQARVQVDAFFASRDVRASLREDVRAACAGTDPTDARACQRAGTAALERVRTRRESAQRWFEGIAIASVAAWLAAAALGAIAWRARRRRAQ